jgi:hypothetical protein
MGSDSTAMRQAALEAALILLRYRGGSPPKGVGNGDGTGIPGDP